MKRAFCVLFVLMATTGASPPRALPLPPIPPEILPSDQSAPLPDRDLRAPDDGGPRTRVSVQDFGPATSEINRAILEIFRNRGVNMPVPQREIRVISNSTPPRNA